jgi:hypothetical protein
MIAEEEDSGPSGKRPIRRRQVHFRDGREPMTGAKGTRPVGKVVVETEETTGRSSVHH